MQPSFLIVADGTTGSAADALSALQSIPELSVTELGHERGITDSVGGLVEWAVKFAGDVSGLADVLIGVAEKYFAGSDIRVRFGDREVEVSNVRRDELLEVLGAVKALADEAEAL